MLRLSSVLCNAIKQIRHLAHNVHTKIGESPKTGNDAKAILSCLRSW